MSSAHQRCTLEPFAVEISLLLVLTKVPYGALAESPFQPKPKESVGEISLPFLFDNGAWYLLNHVSSLNPIASCNPPIPKLPPAFPTSVVFPL